jgi:hypothetical protein
MPHRDLLATYLLALILLAIRGYPQGGMDPR